MISNLISKNNLALVCIVESHSDNKLIDALNKKHNPKMSFIHTHDQDKPKTKGITILTNTPLMNCSPTDIQVIVPGRALQYLTNWYDNPGFTKPHIMLGDMNTVEDPSDCLPPHRDPPQTTNALHDLRSKLNLIDGWRRANPLPEREYTFAQPNGGSRLRIDRIYTTENLYDRASNWSIVNSGIPTDHQMTTVEIYNLNSPKIDRGRWTMKPFIMKDPELINRIEVEGTKSLTNLANPSENPQITLQNLTDHIRLNAQCLTMTKIGRINSELKNLEGKKDKILKKANHLEGTNLERALEKTNHISSRIQDIQSTLFKKNQNITKANWHLYGEMINKYWCAHGKEAKGCNCWNSNA